MALTDEEIEAIRKRDVRARKTLAGLNGLTGIVGSTNSLMQLGNVSDQENMISDINQIGRGLVSYDDISSGYSMLGRQPQFDYDDVRGSTKRERVGNVLSSTTSGAVAGAQIGGLWGGIGGAAVGLGAGLYGLAAGDEAADAKLERNKLNAFIANTNAMSNLNASSEYTTDLMHRQRVANLNSKGGKVRRMLNAKEFADKVFGRQSHRPVTNSSGMVITKCDGGTMIRIKR